MAARTEHVPSPSDNHMQMVFDQNGDVIHKEHLTIPATWRGLPMPDIEKRYLQASCSLGDRLFRCEMNGYNNSFYSLTFPSEVVNDV